MFYLPDFILMPECGMCGKGHFSFASGICYN